MITLVKSLPPNKVPFLGTVDWDADVIFKVTVSWQLNRVQSPQSSRQSGRHDGTG